MEESGLSAAVEGLLAAGRRPEVLGLLDYEGRRSRHQRDDQPLSPALPMSHLFGCAPSTCLLPAAGRAGTADLLAALPVISRRAPAFRCARVVRCAGRVGRPVRGRAIVSPARAPSRCFPRHRAAFGPPLKTRRGRTMPWLVGTALPGFDGAELAKDGKSGPVGETVILLTPPLLPY